MCMSVIKGFFFWFGVVSFGSIILAYVLFLLCEHDGRCFIKATQNERHY